MERLQKILARAGVASRRAAERLIAEGRVSINGEVVRELGTKAEEGRDEIHVDGVRLRAAPQKVYLLLNKPRGVVASRTDTQGRETVMDLVPRIPGLFPVGRLDLTTEGLILLTNDGEFAQRVAHPSFEVPRVYHAKVRGLPNAATLERLRRGVPFEGRRLAADRARVVAAGNNAWVEVVLHEGRQHEVRNLLLAVGHPVSKLRRVAIGPVTDRGLGRGEYRPLSERERRLLLSGGVRAPATATRARERARRAPAARPRVRAGQAAGRARRAPAARSRVRAGKAAGRGRRAPAARPRVRAGQAAGRTRRPRGGRS